MDVEHGDAAAAFREQLATLTAACAALDDRALLAASRCHGWTVLDVLAHVHLGLQEMLLGVVSPTDAAPTQDAASYWRADVPSHDADDAVDQTGFARRLAGVYRRPTTLVRHLAVTADGLDRGAAALTPGAVAFQGHVLTTGDFLATWAVELAVHHLDLGRELDLAPPAGPALRLARATVESLVERPLPAGWSDDVAVLVGTGRLPLDDGQCAEVGELAARLPAF